jgi:hypothetical protein
MLTVPHLTCVERDSRRFGAIESGDWDWRPPATRSGALGDLSLPRLRGILTLFALKPLSDLLFE